MTNHWSRITAARSQPTTLPPRLFPAEPGRTSAAMGWVSAGDDLWSARIQLEFVGMIELVVDRLDLARWDWLVLDSACQALPRYGVAYSEQAAKHPAESAMREVAARLSGSASPFGRSPLASPA